jgi:hypothetical protein
MSNKPTRKQAFLYAIHLALFYFTTFTIQELSPFIHIEQSGNYSIYFLAKLIFAIYWIYISISLGQFLINRFDGIDQYKYDFITNFIIGTSTLQFIGVILGLFGLIKFWVVLPIISFLILLGLFQKVYLFNNNNIKIINIGYPTKIILFVVFILLLNTFILNTQAPLDGDFLTHYGQYYNAVISSGSLKPNDVWYHFFYSKGDGSSFLAIILSDISIKLLLSYCYLIFICFIIFNTVLKNTRVIFWSFFGVYLFLNLLLIDPTGAFSKQHLFIGFNITAIYYLLLKSIEKNSNNNYLIIFPVSSICLISPPSTIYILGLLIGFIFWKFINHSKGFIYLNIKIIIYTISLTLIIIYYNFLITGLYEITPYRTFTELGNYQAISNWISPYLLTYLDQGSNPNLGKFSFEFNYIYSSFLTELRWNVLNLVFPKVILALGGLYAIYIILLKKLFTPSSAPIYLSLVIALLACISFLIVTQSTSVYRSTTFIVIFLSIIFAVGLFLIESKLSQIGRAGYNILFRQFIIFLLAIYLLMTCIMLPNLVGSFRLLLSIDTIDEFYKKHSNNYDPIALELRKNIGKEEKIIDLAMPNNEFGRVFLIGSGIEGEVSYSIGKNWHQIVFDDPKKSSILLKEQGINYFLINKNNIGVGGIAHSSLFSDKFINSYLKIIMENENWKVLTWLDNKIPGKALNKEELRNWMQLRSRESSFPELYNQVKKIYIYNNELTNIKPILPPGLSPVKGWQ